MVVFALASRYVTYQCRQGLEIEGEQNNGGCMHQSNPAHTAHWKRHVSAVELLLTKELWLEEAAWGVRGRLGPHNSRGLPGPPTGGPC
jgi:hypothetical protein